MKCVAVFGPDDRAVSAIESRDLRVVEALAADDDGCDDMAEVEVFVLAFRARLCAEDVDGEWFESVVARGDVFDEDVQFLEPRSSRVGLTCPFAASPLAFVGTLTDIEISSLFEWCRDWHSVSA